MKVKTIYFIRHGETIFNKMKKIQGSSDIPLSEFGELQAKLCVAVRNINFDLFIHSGLIRSKQTLEIIKENLNLSPNKGIIKNDLIIERGYGIFEGLTEEDINKKYPNLFNEWKINENVKLEGAETIENVIDRFLNFCDYIRNEDCENVLAVTHSGFLYAIYKYITDTNLGIRPNVKFPNCCLAILKIHDNKLEFIVGDKTYVY